MFNNELQNLVLTKFDEKFLKKLELYLSLSFETTVVVVQQPYNVRCVQT